MIPAPARRPRVLIIGAGLAGTATAMRLLCFARDPVEIVLLERRPDYRYAGVAYHRAGNPWNHVFNVQAGRMSAFREDVLDFVRWANREADRRHWPAPWADFVFSEQGPAPRRIFQDYLAERLAAARREARPGVVLVEMDGEAVDLDVDAGGVSVTVHRPEPATLRASQVILATGLELRDPPFAAEVREHPSFIRNPYTAASIRTLEALPAEADVAIVGSVLSAYDSAALLLRQGHTGIIHLISRSGTVFRTYPENHEHGVLRLPRPESLLEPYRDREELLVRVRAEWDAACAALMDQNPDIDPAIVTERVAKAWEPYLPAAIELIPDGELRRLLDEFSTPIASLRVCAVEYTMSVIRRALHDDGTVKLVVGRVERIAPTETGRLAVSVVGSDRERVIEADLVVSNFARETDYRRVGNPLWRNLLRKGLAVPHARTGRGVEVDERGVLLGADGEPAGPVCAVGVLREGDEIVRNGRTGAFAFNLATIKNQSITAAAHVLEQVGHRDESLVAALAEYPGDLGTPGQAAPAGFEEAVVLEVRRLAARTRSERERIDSRLGAHIRAIGEPHGLPSDASRQAVLIRTAVNRAAVRRLTDVSVTPRQLRRQLGLADDPED